MGAAPAMRSATTSAVATCLPYISTVGRRGGIIMWTNSSSVDCAWELRQPFIYVDYTQSDAVRYVFVVLYVAVIVLSSSSSSSS